MIGRDPGEEMSKNICIIQGHPHTDHSHFCYALADSYAEGARSADYRVKTIILSEIEIPYLLDPKDFETPPPTLIRDAQAHVKQADHLVVVYPLWLGTMPALVKSFFEQLSRNEFALASSEEGGWPRKMFKGRSARVIVTMGMPALAYRTLFGAHGVKSFETAILGMAGFKPIHDTLIGGVGSMSKSEYLDHLDKMRKLGERGK